MRGENLLVGMTQIDDSLIAFAESYNGKKKKNYRKSIIRAASVFLLLSAAVVLAIISHGKRYEFNADGKITFFQCPAPFGYQHRKRRFAEITVTFTLRMNMRICAGTATARSYTVQQKI